MLDYKELFRYIFEGGQLLLIRLEEENDPKAMLEELRLLIRDTVDLAYDMDPSFRIEWERLDETEKALMIISDGE